MTLRDLLNDYFRTNSGMASDAMNGGLLGWNPQYPSNYDIWVADKDIQTIPVDHQGGEDMGSTYFSVYKFTRGDETVFIKFHGWYASYDGSNYDDFTFVTPQTKTVVVYG